MEFKTLSLWAKCVLNSGRTDVSARNIKQNIVDNHGHSFTKKTFNCPRPIYCHHCLDLLNWKLFNNGLNCEGQNFIPTYVHHVMIYLHSGTFSYIIKDGNLTVNVTLIDFLKPYNFSFKMYSEIVIFNVIRTCTLNFIMIFYSKVPAGR